ncbi:MAG: ComEC/Rec2 family competence protein [Muribaculaceae bacterium]|nr:ComEC/Rec2 family competence protein [Muribaculaceae bacterium]
MKSPLSNIPLLPICIGIIIGIILGENIPFIYILIPFISGICIYISNQKVISFTLFSISLGWICYIVNDQQSVSTKHLNDESVFYATALEIKNGDNMRNIIAEIDSKNDSDSIYHLSKFKCSLAIPSLNPIIEEGDKFAFIGELTNIKDNRDLPDEFDLINFLNNQGIYTSAFVDPENIYVIGNNDSFINDLNQLRNHITSIITSLPLSENCIEFLNTTITGDTSMLSEDQRLKYSTSGLAHILALSGLHVGIISLVIAITLFPLDTLRLRKLRYCISIIALWIYAIMTGLSPSVTRAVIMATIFLLSNILHRNHSPINSLCAAAILILIFSPLSIHDIGFQLSFVAVLSILLFARKLNPINERRRILYNFVGIATVSLSAMIGTGIIAAFYFHNFPIYFLISNIVATYLLPIIIIGGIIAIIISGLGFDPTFICIITDYAYNIIDWITTSITTLPGASIDTIYFNGWILIPYFGCVACLYLSLKHKRLVWYIITTIFVIFTITISLISREQYPNSEYYIPRNTYYTNIILRDSSSMYIISTAHGGDSIDVVNNCEKKYKDYMGWRNVDTLIYVSNNFKDNNILRNDPFIVIGEDAIAIIDNDNDVMTYDTRPRYALVCNGFKGNIIDLYKTISPDTILLSKDLNKRRINRYIDSCATHKIPFISLREKGYYKRVK